MPSEIQLCHRRNKLNLKLNEKMKRKNILKKKKFQPKTFEQ